MAARKKTGTPDSVKTACNQTAFVYNRTLKYGAEGEDVKALQAALSSAGCDVAISGVFDMATVRAVQKRQQEKKLPANGIVGKAEFPVLLDME